MTSSIHEDLSEEKVAVPRWLWITIGTILMLFVGAVGTLVGWTIQELKETTNKNETRISDHDKRLAGIEASRFTVQDGIRSREMMADAFAKELVAMEERNRNSIQDVKAQISAMRTEIREDIRELKNEM